MDDDGKSKVTIHIEMKFSIDITDDGYLGPRESVASHINRARQDVANWQWFVKKGGLDVVPVQGSSKVTNINIVPGRGY